MEFIKKNIIYVFYIFCIVALFIFGRNAINLGDKFFLTENEANIYLDSNYQIEIDNVNKLEKSLGRYKYISKNEDIATVDSNGLVTPKKSGTAEIEVKNGAYKEIIKIKITDDNVKLIGDNISVNVGETYDFNNLIKSKSNALNYKYEIKNSNIATVDEYGIIKGVSIGETEAYIYTKSDKKTTVKVYVKQKAIEVESVVIYPSSVSLTLGESTTLNAIVLPGNATDKNIKWDINNDSLIIDQNGKITAVKEGSAIVSAKASNGLEGLCMVNISATSKVTTTTKPSTTTTTTRPATTTTTRPATTTRPTTQTTRSTTTTTTRPTLPTTSVSTTVTLNASSVRLKVGDTFQFIAIVKPQGTKIKWSSSDTSVATISSGLVTAKKAGDSIITVTTSNGKTATAIVRISDKNVVAKRIDVSDKSFTMSVGESKTITASVYPANASDNKLTWTSSDASVATVSNGLIKAKKAGTCNIVVKNGKLSNTIKVTVKDKVVVPTSITLSKTSATLASTKKLTVTATISPSNVDNKKITWSTSDSSIATVSNGVITAKKAGTVKITAKTYNNKSAVLTLTVRPIDIVLVGNSKTYRNPSEYPSVYDIFVAIFKEKYSANVSKSYVGGSSLLEHARGKCIDTCSSTQSNNSLANAKKVLTNKKYDIAVLQERTNYAYSLHGYENGVKEIKKLLLSKNSSTEIYLRQSWYYKSSYTSSGISKQTTLNKNASNIAKTASIKIVKDGQVFYDYYKKYGDTKLFIDDTHPSYEGAYVASLCMYKTFTGEQVSNIKYTGKVNTDRAKKLQAIVDSACK